MTWTLTAVATLVLLTLARWDWAYRRRLKHTRAHLVRLRERTERIQEDVYWAVLRDLDTQLAQAIHEAREGLPALTLRLLHCEDEPSLRIAP